MATLDADPESGWKDDAIPSREDRRRRAGVGGRSAEHGGGAPRGGTKGVLEERGGGGKNSSLMGHVSSGRRWGESGLTLFSGFPGKRRPRESKNNQSVWVGFSLISI